MRRLKTQLPILLSLAFVTCVLEADQVLPPIPPGHDMVYASEGLALRRDIYLLTAAGDEGNLTQHIAYDGFPSWSPDGQRIAFESDRDHQGRTEVYVLNSLVNPTQVVRLTIDSVTTDSVTWIKLADHEAGQPAWSPLSNRIAFVSNRDSAGLDIYLMNPNGSNLTRLTTDTGSSALPAWSPTGDRIAFASDRASTIDIWVMDTLGGNLVQLTNDPAIDLAPAWSPDGTKIAFHSTRDGNDFAIWVMNANGTNLVQISGSEPPCELPHWTPDGQRIAFDCDGDIYVTNADGTNRVQITRTTNQQRLEVAPRWRP